MANIILIMSDYTELSLFNQNDEIYNDENLKFNEKNKKNNKKLNFNISHTIIIQESFNFNNNCENNQDLEIENDEENYNEDINSEYEDTSDTNQDMENLENDGNLVGLGAFFKEVNKYKLLTREEEHRYFIEYQKNHDDELKKFLISSNIKLVIAVAKKISQKTKKITLEDMIDEGIIGLIRAIDKFEPNRNLKFSTYAFAWIQQSITRYIANTGDMIRVPVHFSDNLSKIKRFENKYMMENNIDKINNEITSKELNIPLSKIEKYKNATQNISSLDVNIDENENTMLDILEDKKSENPENAILNISLHDALMNAINTLDKREAYIIINRFNLDKSINPLSLNDLAKKFNLTKERIRQIESSALQKLRHPMKSKEFREFY